MRQGNYFSRETVFTMHQQSPRSSTSILPSVLPRAGSKDGACAAPYSKRGNAQGKSVKCRRQEIKGGYGKLLTLIYVSSIPGRSGFFEATPVTGIWLRASCWKVFVLYLWSSHKLKRQCVVFPEDSSQCNLCG